MFTKILGKERNFVFVFMNLYFLSNAPITPAFCFILLWLFWKSRRAIRTSPQEVASQFEAVSLRKIPTCHRAKPFKTCADSLPAYHQLKSACTLPTCHKARPYKTCMKTACLPVIKPFITFQVNDCLYARSKSLLELFNGLLQQTATI